MTLSQTQIGESVCIDKMNLNQDQVRRLRSLGMMEGTKVKVLQKKRSGTLVVDVRGTRFAIGYQMGDEIGVKAL